METDRIKQIREGYGELIRSWQWDLHITLDFSKPLSSGVAESLVRRDFLDPMKSRFGNSIQIAGMFFIKVNEATGIPHAHLFLISNPFWRHYLFFLDDKELQALKNFWKYGCEITRPNQSDNRLISAYPTKDKNLPLNRVRGRSNLIDEIVEGWGPYYFRPNLLRKLKQPRRAEPITPNSFRLKEPDWETWSGAGECPQWFESPETIRIYDDLAEGLWDEYHRRQESYHSA